MKTIDSLTPGTSYQFRITPLSAVGEGLSSSLTVKTTPPKPTGISLISQHDSIQVSWVAPTITTGNIVTGYKIYKVDEGKVFNLELYLKSYPLKYPSIFFALGYRL